MKDDAVTQDSNLSSVPNTLTLPQVSALGRQISKNFNNEELQAFCFELDIDYVDWAMVLV